MTAAHPNIEILLDHQDWVRALARSLVADPSRADDVAQQTMLEAMTAPPRDLSRPKGWLARVAKNAARAFARQDSRRRRREEVVSKSDVVHADPADAAHRAVAHKRLVDELFELEEPYHTVLLLRFFDDLDARQIAARLDRPLATVRTQLQRGLDRMRERLDREFGDRSAWCAALMPLFAPKSAVVSVPVLGTLGALVMWKWILPGVAVIAALFVGLQFIGADLGDPTPGGGTPNTVAAATGSGSPAPFDVEPDRQPVVTPPVDAPVVDDPAPAAGPAVRGRAVNVDGRAVPGLTLAYYDPEMPRLDGTMLWQGNGGIDIEQPSLQRQLASDRGIRFFARRYAPYEDAVVALIRGEPVDRPHATTDGAGRFEIAGVDDIDDVRVESSEWMRYGIGKLRGEADPILVVGPAVHVAGRVVDPAGSPIEDVYLSMGFSVSSLPGIAQQFEDGSGYRSWNENTDSDGEFDLGVMPAHPALKVHAQKRGYVGVDLVTTDVVGRARLVLRPKPADERKILSGIVRHADGRPAGGAYLRFGGTGGVADDNGRFEFEIGYAGVGTPLTAWMTGLQPAILEGLGARLRNDPTAGRDLVLTLGGETLAIAGRVLDAAGEPLVGVRVMLGDGTPYGTFYGALESWIAKQDSDGERTDEAGAFSLRGLSARPYTVRAIDEKSLLVIESAAVAAGTADLVMRAPADALLPRIEGVLVDRFGGPIVGAEIDVTAVLQKSGNGSNTLLTREPAVTSDGAGRFAIDDCPRRHVELWIHGDGVKSTTIAVPTDGQELRIVVPRMLRFTLRSARKQEADSFAILDALGKRLHTTANKPGVISTDSEHRLPEGGSPVYEVDDTAIELVLLEGDDIVRRLALNLRNQVLNEIDL